MGKYQVWLTANDGDDIPQALEDWDGESELELRLAAFANNAVITIEPKADATLSNLEGRDGDSK